MKWFCSANKGLLAQLNLCLCVPDQFWWMQRCDFIDACGIAFPLCICVCTSVLWNKNSSSWRNVSNISRTDWLKTCCLYWFRLSIPGSLLENCVQWKLASHKWLRTVSWSSIMSNINNRMMHCWVHVCFQKESRWSSFTLMLLQLENPLLCFIDGTWLFLPETPHRFSITLLRAAYSFMMCMDGYFLTQVNLPSLKTNQNLTNK